ncbi:MAG: LacI family DNA-binding transcriptional regulator [Ruminococcus sp.]|nr:LacI family DNA-binding transcriptional regulator [Ruminococcus sp.]
MNVTVKDVAREAGVSVATVSRVLNGSDAVTEKSAQRVREAVVKLGYSPNFLGRNLRKRATNVILVIIPNADHSLYMKICAGMQACALRYGYDIITAVSNAATAVETRHLNMLFNKTVDGAVLMGTSFDAGTLNRLAEEYDIALCCEGVTGADVLTVTVDDERAGYDAADALIKLGHRRLGFIGVESNALSASLREEGFLRALGDHGIELPEEYIYRDTYDAVNGAKAMERFLALAEPPTAVFAVSDLIALSAVRRAAELGCMAGKDISVIGFDDIDACSLTTPSLSTVAQNCSEMSEVVCRKLIENIKSERKDRGYYTVEHRVMMRESTGVLNKK